MARKKKHPEHENLERWLVSYADFITLLFATFTALYALSLSDANKLKDISAAIAAGFEEQSLIHGIKSILQGNNPPSREPDPTSSRISVGGSGLLGMHKSMTYQPGEVESVERFAQQLALDLDEVNAEIQKQNRENTKKGGSGGTEDGNTPMRPVQMSVQGRGLRLSLDSRLLFPPGNAALQPSARKVLDVVAKRIKHLSSGNIIHVEGHTDSLPIATAVYPSNWELSGARASSIVRYFIQQHDFKANALVAVGYGDTQPLADNRTPEGRSRNRRVDLIIYSRQASASVNPRQQFMGETRLTVHNDDSSDREVVPSLPDSASDGPVRVIIKEKDGTERILVPKTQPVQPSAASSDTLPPVVIHRDSEALPPAGTP